MPVNMNRAEKMMDLFQELKKRIRRYGFLFSELVKRDFKKKYKRSMLGIFWSILGPLLQLLVMSLVFKHFFGRTMEHFTIYLFAGNLIFNYFKESTSSGMSSLMDNAGIITKVNSPKYLFLLSKNISSLINFLLTLVIFFLFVIIDQVPVNPRFILLVYPVTCLLVFNIGVGLILSALFIFFKDVKYLYDIFTILLMYLSAIFYTVESFPPDIQRLFMFNPVFTYIHYFRLIVLHGVIPSINVHLICGLYAVTVLFIGGYFYKKYNYRFLYYM
jgi:ABC-2 type transport system permease protein